MIGVASFAAEARWLSKCWRSLAQGQGDISTQLGIINGRKTLLTTIWLNLTWVFSARCNQCVHIWLKFDLPSVNQHWHASHKWDCLKVGIPPNGHDHGKMIMKLSINIFSGAQRKKPYDFTHWTWPVLWVSRQHNFEPQYEYITVQCGTRETCPVHGVISSPRRHAWSSSPAQNSPLASWEPTQSKTLFWLKTLKTVLNEGKAFVRRSPTLGYNIHLWRTASLWHANIGWERIHSIASIVWHRSKPPAAGQRGWHQKFQQFVNLLLSKGFLANSAVSMANQWGMLQVEKNRTETAVMLLSSPGAIIHKSIAVKDLVVPGKASLWIKVKWIKNVSRSRSLCMMILGRCKTMFFHVCPMDPMQTTICFKYVRI